MGGVSGIQKATANEVEKFEALVHTIPDVVVPFELHTINVLILSPSADLIIGVKLPPRNKLPQFSSEFRWDSNPNEHVKEYCVEMSLVALPKEDQLAITVKYFTASLAGLTLVRILD